MKLNTSASSLIGSSTSHNTSNMQPRKGPNSHSPSPESQRALGSHIPSNKNAFHISCGSKNRLCSSHLAQAETRRPSLSTSTNLKNRNCTKNRNESHSVSVPHNGNGIS